MGIINVIEMWIVGLEKSIKIKAIVTQINSQYNPVLRVATYQNWGNLMNIGNLILYHMIRYKRTDIHNIKSTCGWGPNMHFIKHKHG